jgi:hypothetical protein
VKDFLFVDALSRAPVGREEENYAPPIKRENYRSGLKALLVAIIGLIILLASWAFS